MVISNQLFVMKAILEIQFHYFTTQTDDRKRMYFLQKSIRLYGKAAPGEEY
jgi:hypothetical protein